MNDQRHGTNGGPAYSSNGHTPKFRIELSGPDITQQILSARDEVIEDNELSIGSRLMFVRILDLAVRSSSNVRPGVVTISQTKLAEFFNVSTRTVWNWRSELIRKRYVWMTAQPMPNAWPIDTYHVALIHAPHHSGDKTSLEGLWGNGERQRAPLRGLGARQPGQVQIPGTGVRSNGLREETGFRVTPDSSILPDNATPHRNPLRASTETGCDSPPKQVATPHRSQLRSPVETSCEPPPKQVATPNRNQLRRATETDCEHKKAKDQGSSHFEGGSGATTPPDLAFETWEKSLDGQFPSHLRRLEKTILGRLERTTKPTVRDGLKRQLRAVRDRLLPPVPDAETPGPVRSVKPGPAKPVLSQAEQDAIREKIQRGALRAAVEAAR